MAQRDNRGIGGFAPFPTFAPGGEGGLIPQVKMPQSRMSFPTPRGGGGGSKSVNPAAYFAPGIIGALTEKFLPKPETKERESTGDKRLDRILMEADLTYGADQEDPSFLQNLLPSLIDAGVAAGFGDEGGAQYAQTAVNRRIANRQTDAGVATRKRQFIKERLKLPALQDVTLQDAVAAKVRKKDVYKPGLFNAESGVTYVHDPVNYEKYTDDEKNPHNSPHVNYVATSHISQEGRSWINSKVPEGKSLTEMLNKDNPNVAEIRKLIVAHRERERAVGGSLTNANNLIEYLDTAIANPETAGTTWVSNIYKQLDSLDYNFRQIATIGGKEFTSIFATEDDVANNKANGTGKAAASLYGNFESDIGDIVLDGRSIRDIIGTVAYNNVQYRSMILQMAYLAAAANGQTGRTLSDKDLAYHLEIIGGKNVQKPEHIRMNLLRFMDALVQNSDNDVQYLFPINTLSQQYDMTDPDIQNLLRTIYTPNITGQNSDGTDIEDWSNSKNWTRKTYYGKHGGANGIKSVIDWQNHPRPKGAELPNQSSSVTPITRKSPVLLDDDYLKTIERNRGVKP